MVYCNFIVSVYSKNEKTNPVNIDRVLDVLNISNNKNVIVNSAKYGESNGLIVVDIDFDETFDYTDYFAGNSTCPSEPSELIDFRTEEEDMSRLNHIGYDVDYMEYDTEDNFWRKMSD